MPMNSPTRKRRRERRDRRKEHRKDNMLLRKMWCGGKLWQIMAVKGVTGV